MPRKARITMPGAVHHVMSRGIEGNPIFRSDEDRFVFLNFLETQLIQSGYLLYAWCLMEKICRKIGIHLQALQCKGRAGASLKARRILSCICIRQHGIPTGEVARYLGVTSSAVSNMVLARDSYDGGLSY